MSNPQIMFCASTYRSNSVAATFLRSLDFAGYNNLVILVSPDEGDLVGLKEIKTSYPKVGLHTKINVMHYCRGLAFVWAQAHGIKPEYVCFCDDDLIFKEASNNFYSRLNDAKLRYDFSLAGFKSNMGDFFGYVPPDDNKFRVGVGWLDGNAIFASYEDVLQYGVMDSLKTVPLSYFVEVEYSHRFRALKDRPIVYDVSDVYYIHRFRSDPDINSTRLQYCGDGLEAGTLLWKLKFGVDANMNDSQTYNDLYEQCNRDKNNYKRHMVFGGEWNDWDKIWHTASQTTKEVFNET